MPRNDLNAYIKAVFAPHGAPAAFRNTEAFGFVDEDRVYPFDDCNLPELDAKHLEAWAGSSEKAALMAEQLFIWLHGSSGCLYGFWSHDGRPMLESPVGPQRLLAEGQNHTTTHSFASHAVIRGIPIRQVQEWLGHAAFSPRPARRRAGSRRRLGG